MYFATPLRTAKKRKISCDTLDTIADNKDHKGPSEGSHPTYKYCKPTLAPTCTLPPFANCDLQPCLTRHETLSNQNHSTNKETFRGSRKTPRRTATTTFSHGKKINPGPQEEQRYCITCHRKHTLNHSSYDGFSNALTIQSLDIPLHVYISFLTNPCGN